MESSLSRSPLEAPITATTTTTTTTTTTQLGPDLNGSRAPLDTKLYRHITLPNGLQAVLIQDNLAMQQLLQSGEGLLDDMDDLDDLVGANDDDDNDNNDDDNDDDNDDGNDNREQHANEPTKTTSRHPKRHGKGNGNDQEEDQDDDDDHSEDDETDPFHGAAICIVVGAGSVSDPEHCPGLAHFLEHLLFMGSQKFPGENDYPSFVAKHGGADSAWTEWEYTAYSFELADQQALWGAVDRLAQFFVQPLLLPSAVERELKSIESEFQLHKNKDGTRHKQLICSTAKHNHPVAKFSWGSHQSIHDIPTSMGIDPLVELRAFYNQHYYAHNMRLVIQGAYTLNHLQDGVVKYFAEIPAHPRDGSRPHQQLQHMLTAGAPFRTEILGTVTRIIPVRERHELTLTWQVPCQFGHWRSKPLDFISHLMGHEASGSLLSYARSQSWAMGCMAGGDDEGSENATSHALLTMSFTLSDAGLLHWRELVDAVYQYLGLLRQQGRNGWPPYIFDELQRVNDLSYRYGDEASPEETVTYLAEEMAPCYRVPVERLLDGSALLFEFDEVAVQSLLDEYIKPELARYDLMSSSFGKPTDFEAAIIPDGDIRTTVVSELVIRDENENGSFDVTSAGAPQVEPMFGTQFWCRKLPQSWLDQWTASWESGTPSIEMLRLPPPNPFVPHDLTLKGLPVEDADHPLLNAALKLCISVGKTKQWFPATVVQYNHSTNSVLLSFEDEDEKWHVLDDDASKFKQEALVRFDTFEGTMDSKAIKFKIVALSLYPGAKGAGIRKFGDETDWDVEEGTTFPPIPPQSTRQPTQISNTNALKMWWLQDRKFKRPIAEFRLQIMCANANASPLHRACADLLEHICADALLETAYLAEMYELDSEFEATDVGFSIRFNGYNDKLLDLFQTTLQMLLDFRNVTDLLPTSIHNDRFAACLEILMRQYKNSGMSSSSLTSAARLQAIRPTSYSAHKKLTALDGITVAKFCATVSHLWESYAVEAFLHGNADKNDATKAKETLIAMLDATGGAVLPRKKYPSQSVLRIPTAGESNLLVLPSKDPEEPNTACEVYIQVGKDNLQDRVMMDLLMHVINEPMFDQIRTKDQFGYDVYCDVRWTYGIIGCIFHVTTNSKSAADVVQRIDTFITHFRSEIVSMSTKDFQEHVVGLAKQKLAMFDCLSDETGYLWGEIYDGRFEWDAWRDETICLRGITKADVLKAYDAWLLPGNRRNVLTVQVIGAVDTAVSLGRPVVDADILNSFVDEQVASFHRLCKHQTWGRVNSKLW